MSENYSFKDSSIYVKAVQESRYLNIHFIFNCQSAFGIPQPIREAGGLILCKKLLDFAECRIMSDMLGGLTEEQMKSLMHLEPFEGIIINKEQGTVPVRVLIPKYPTQFVSMEMINDRQGKALKNRILNGVVRKRPYEIIGTNTVEELDYRLRIVMENFRLPFLTQKERMQFLGLDKISDCIFTLLQNIWLEKYRTQFLLGRSGKFQLYLFTEKAESNFSKQIIQGKGDLNHTFWQYRIFRHFTNRGYHCTIEKFQPDGSGESIDVEAINVKKGGEKIAIEVELNDNIYHIKSNILKCIRAKYDLIIIAPYSTKLLRRVQRIALSNQVIEKYYSSGRLELKLVTEFMY
jgi:hypothetical protein